MENATISRPVPFLGSTEERLANRATHEFHQYERDEPGECIHCAVREYHTAANYPCGTKPPREILTLVPDESDSISNPLPHIEG